MGKFPRWDYWQEEYSEGKLIIFDRPDSELDIRHERYDLNVFKWGDKAFWNAEEAALISFYRDPEKVNSNRDLLLWADDEDVDPLFEEHNALMKHAGDLHNAIRDSQRKGQLPDDFFPATTYVEWAQRVGASLPPGVVAQVRFAERERRGEIEQLNAFEAAKFGRRPRGMEDDQSQKDVSNRKSAGPAKKAENNSTKFFSRF